MQFLWEIVRSFEPKLYIESKHARAIKYSNNNFIFYLFYKEVRGSPNDILSVQGKHILIWMVSHEDLFCRSEDR